LDATIDPLLDSLMDQTLEPDEFVVADGGSTDDTREIFLTAQNYPGYSRSGSLYSHHGTE